MSRYPRVIRAKEDKGEQVVIFATSQTSERKAWRQAREGGPFIESISGNILPKDYELAYAVWECKKSLKSLQKLAKDMLELAKISGMK